MKKLQDHVLYSTNVDKHGDKLSQTDLRTLFDQTPDPYVLNQAHDASLEPVGKAFNIRFKALDDGEFAIIADVEIYKESLWEGECGFSFSYKGRLYTVNNKRNAEIEVLFNPRYFDTNDVVPVVELSNDSYQIDAQELIQKGWEVVPILIVTFVSREIASAFFGQAVADLYGKLKEVLLTSMTECKERTQSEPKFQLRFPGELRSNIFDIVLDMRAEDLEYQQSSPWQVDDMMKFIESKVGDSEIQKVVIRPIKEKPYWRIDHFINSEGKVVSI